MSDSPYRTAFENAGCEAIRCLFCGQEARTDGMCPSCGAIGRPDSTAGDLVSGHCPRCGVALVTDSFGRSTIKRCASCNGAFVPAIQFSYIVNDYLAGADLPLGSFPPPPPDHRSAIDSRINPVACIACGRQMDRINFATRSGAVIDVCTPHGLWLDAGELVPILHFVRTRAELREVPLSDAEREAAAVSEPMRAALEQCEAERRASWERLSENNLRMHHLWWRSRSGWPFAPNDGGSHHLHDALRALLHPFEPYDADPVHHRKR